MSEKDFSADAAWPWLAIVFIFDDNYKIMSLCLLQVDGNIPTCVKRNAHELILDFIRSRPPLKPVSSSQYLTTTVQYHQTKHYA